MDNAAQLTLARYKKLLLLTVGAIVGACVVGLLGGWLLYENHEGGRIFAAYLMLPGVAAAIVFTLPIRILRKRWFPTKESLAEATKLMAASQQKPAEVAPAVDGE